MIWRSIIIDFLLYIYSERKIRYLRILLMLENSLRYYIILNRSNYGIEVLIFRKFMNFPMQFVTVLIVFWNFRYGQFANCLQVKKSFPNKILWTDEITYKRNGIIFNQHNKHYYAEKKIQQGKKNCMAWG